MPEAIRVTFHNSRTNKRGKAHNPNHNDRNFDISKAPHIDPDRQHLNLFWTRYMIEPFRRGDGNPQDKRYGFVAAEAAFYKEQFSAFLEARNANRRRSRNRTQTMDEYRKARQSCPEETLFYLGGRKNFADPKDITNIMQDFIAWHEEKYPAVHFLDWSLHQDERGAPHIHLRKVWVAHDEAGRPFVGQEAALMQMGVKPSSGKETPDPKQPAKTIEKARFNNRKKTYTADCLRKLQELARDYDYTIEDMPREKSKAGRDLDEYIADEKAQEAREAEQRAHEAEERAKVAAREEKRATAAVELLTRQQHDRLEKLEEAFSKLDATRWTAALKAVDDALKGFSLKPSTAEAKTNAKAAREAVDSIADTLELLRAFATSAGETTEQAAAYASMQRRLTRTRNAIAREEKRQRDLTDQNARLDEEAASKQAQQAQRWQAFLEKMSRTLDEAKERQQKEADEKENERERNFRQRVDDAVKRELKAYSDDLERMEQQAERLEEQAQTLKAEIADLEKRKTEAETVTTAQEKKAEDATALAEAADEVKKEAQEELSKVRQSLAAAKAEKPSESLLASFRAFHQEHGSDALCDATKAMQEEAARLTHTEWSSDEEASLAQELYNAAHPQNYRGDKNNDNSKSYHW